MSSWNTVSDIVRRALCDLYSDGQLVDDEFWRLESIDGVIMQNADKYLASAVSVTGDEALSKLSVAMKHYVDSANNWKDLEVGYTTRRVVPSIILHQRGNEKYNTLAMFVKCGWKTKRQNLCTNYSNALACVLGRLEYASAICVELRQHRSKSQAFMTSTDHIKSILDSPSAELVDRLLAITDENLRPCPWREVVALRDRLFIDVSDDLFGIPVVV